MGINKKLLHTAPEGYWLEKTYGYTEDGMLSTISYYSQYGKLCTEQLVYRNGTLTEVYLDDGTCVYSYSEEDRHGQLTRIATGEYDRRYEFDEWGFPTQRRILYGDGKVLMDQRYEFDAATGNLKSRKDALRNRTELFEYDALQRLILYAGKKVEYTPDGNIIRKGDAGEMVYTNPNRPYAVTGNTPEKEACIHSGLQVGYTAADRPAWIEEGNRRAEFTYNALFDRVRVKMNEEGKTVDTRYYLGGNYEAHCDSSGTEERLYVGGDYYEAPAILVKKEGKTDIRFLHRDYLGSILQVADNKGNIIEENSFDAWGSRRDPDTQEIYTGTEVPNLMTGRGFTGHEHLDGFGLIHMNARLYDPILGRFLSPDPYVQLPDFTQAMNRYGYCMNRPLCYVDKNGEIIGWIIAGAIIGGAINVALHADQINSLGQFFGYFGVGAAAGALGPLAGGAVGGAGFIGGAIGGMVGGAASGFTLGTGNTLMGGGDFANAMVNGAMGAFSGAICGGALGGVIGGGTAIVKGQNFWHGNTIAQGRGMFSWKNTPVGETGALNSVPEMMPDAMPKTPKPDTPLANSPQPSIGSNEKIRNIAERLKPELQPVTNTQEVRVTLIEGDLKMHFRIETHTGVNNVFKDMNLHPQDYVRHANIELFYLRDGKWIRTPIPGTKEENFHIFLNLVNKHIK